MTKTKPAHETSFKYTDLDGKEQVYQLRQEEFLTSSTCPIDGQPLYETIRGSGLQDETVYSCPCCRHDYYSLEPKRLKRSRKIILDALSEKLAELRVQESYLAKILALAQGRAKLHPLGKYVELASDKSLKETLECGRKHKQSSPK